MSTEIRTNKELAEYDRFSRMLMNADKEHLRAFGRLRSRIGRAVMEHVAAETQIGRTADMIHADMLRFAAYEYGISAALSRIPPAKVTETAKVMAKHYADCFHSGFEMGRQKPANTIASSAPKKFSGLAPKKRS